jgi:hypothetical protein
MWHHLGWRTARRRSAGRRAGIADLLAAGRRRASIATTGVVLGVACGPSRRPPERPAQSAATVPTVPVAPPEDTTAQGVVRYVGSGESAQLVLADGAVHLALVGDLAAELRRLQGAEVQVAGPALPNPGLVPPRAVRVTRYEIVSLAGGRPVVGRVDRWQGHVWLIRAADTLELLAAPAELASLLGAKVFVLGPVDAGRVRVVSYGVLREPPR